MPWPGRSSRSSSPTKATVHAPSDTVTCHFCNRSYALPSAHHHLRSTSSSSSSISPTTRQTIKGSWSSFQCPNCESWNLRDPATGDFVEDAQLYSDPSLNTAGPPSVRRSRFAKQDDQSAAAPPFCRDCLINQNLQVQLLAGYVPRDANDAQQARLWDNLANYRRSLDERYPLVCANCQGRIEKIIEERDWKAKARTVGGWLKKSAQVQADQNLPFDRRRSHHLRMIWRIKGCLWAAIYVVTLLHSLHINIPLAIPLSILPDTWLSRVVKENIAVIAASSFLLSFWDPTYGERQRYDGNLQIHGVWRWRCLQGLAYVARVALVLTPHSSTSLGPFISYGTAALHLALLASHNRIIYTSGPRRARLVHHSRPSTPVKLAAARTSDATQQPKQPGVPFPPHSNTSSTEATFGRVSMGSEQRSHSAAQRRNPYSARLDDLDAGPTSMEWQQTHGNRDVDMHDVHMADLDDNNDAVSLMLEPGSPGTREINLRPAVFNPSDDHWHQQKLGDIRGLEKLFEQGVTLDDIRENGVSQDKDDENHCVIS